MDGKVLLQLTDDDNVYKYVHGLANNLHGHVQLTRRESILQRCGTVFTASVVFIVACLLHENLPGQNLAAKCAFALTSVALGVAIFLGYLVSSEGYIAQTRTLVDNFRLVLTLTMVFL